MSKLKLKKMMSAVLFGGAMMAAVAPAQAEGPMVVNVSVITMDVANTIAVNTIKACREKGIPVSVIVVDRNGITQA